MSPEAQEKKKSRCVYTVKRKKEKKENKSLTDDVNSTFIEELENNSKSYGHCHLVHQMEVVVVGIHRMVVEVEVVVDTILVVVDIVVQNAQS
jgi:hypothetical protein